ETDEKGAPPERVGREAPKTLGESMKRLITLSTLAAVAALALASQSALASRGPSEAVRARANASGYAAEEQGEFRWHGPVAAGRTTSARTSKPTRSTAASTSRPRGWRARTPSTARSPPSWVAPTGRTSLSSRPSTAGLT